MADVLQLRPLQERICQKCGCIHVSRKSWCKPCTKKYNADYRKKHAEKLKLEKLKHYENNKADYIARAKEWKSNNHDKVAISIKKYYALNKKKETARIAEWESNNKERRKAAKRDWRQHNKARLAAQCRERQARKLNATPAWASLREINIEYELAKWCTDVLGIQYHVDHVVPLQGRNVCGLHVHYNLQVIRAIDNLKKGCRHG